MKEFIDATVFLGMHSKNESVRIACKNFFIQRFKKPIFMSLENVGFCDDVVWQYDSSVQNAYYPFLDLIHTIVNIKRISYDKKDFDILRYKTIPSNLNFSQKLTLSMVLSRKGTLFTFDKDLLKLNLKTIRTPPKQNKELVFPDPIEKIYQKSLLFRIII